MDIPLQQYAKGYLGESPLGDSCNYTDSFLTQTKRKRKEKSGKKERLRERRGLGVQAT